MTRGLLLAVLALPCPGLSQPETAAEDDLSRTIQAIEQQAEEGALSPDLIDPLKALARLYSDGGDYALALATIERTLDIVRINYGLYSLEQVPLLQQAMANEKARGNDAAAWDLQRELLSLIERHPDDLTTVPIFRDIANERLDLIDRYIAGEFPPEIVLGCYYRSSNVAFGSCQAGSKGTAVRHILAEAKEYYENAIDVLLRNELYSSEELPELEMKLIRINYFHGSEFDPPTRYEEGKRHLNRLIDYEAEGSDTLHQFDTLVQIGDWDLMYSNNSEALDTYEDAYEQLRQHDVSQEAIDRLFAPDTPVVLPAFLPNPLASGETDETRGHIDVAFEITRFGRSRKIDVLDTAGATRQDRNRLAELIKKSRFRPQTHDGEFADASHVVLRYYLNE